MLIGIELAGQYLPKAHTTSGSWLRGVSWQRMESVRWAMGRPGSEVPVVLVTLLHVDVGGMTIICVTAEPARCPHVWAQHILRRTRARSIPTFRLFQRWCPTDHRSVSHF